MSLEAITVRPLLRPAFDNKRVESRDTWIDDNSNLLARYWRDLGAAVGISESDTAEIDFWLRVQWDIERARVRLPPRLPHGEEIA